MPFPILGAALSLAGGAAGGIMNSIGSNKAAKAAKQAQVEANYWNQWLQDKARGATGSAVLPVYAAYKDGTPFEPLLFKSVHDAWKQTPRRTAADYGERLESSGVDQMRQRGLKAVDDLFSGAMEEEYLQNFRPVREARVNFNRQAAMDSLNKTLGEIAAVNAGRGFTSDSMGNRLLRLQANKAMADQIAAAELAGLEQERAIRDMATQLRLQNASLPYALAQSELDYYGLPTRYATAEMEQSLQPFSFFRIGPSGGATEWKASSVAPTTGPWSILAQTVGRAGNMLADWGLNKPQPDSGGGGPGTDWDAVGEYFDFLDNGGYDSLIGGGGGGDGGTDWNAVADYFDFLDSEG